MVRRESDLNVSKLGNSSESWEEEVSHKMMRMLEVVIGIMTVKKYHAMIHPNNGHLFCYLRD